MYGFVRFDIIHRSCFKANENRSLCSFQLDDCKSIFQEWSTVLSRGLNLDVESIQIFKSWIFEMCSHQQSFVNYRIQTKLRNIRCKMKTWPIDDFRILLICNFWVPDFEVILKISRFYLDSYYLRTSVFLVAHVQVKNQFIPIIIVLQGILLTTENSCPKSSENF